MLFADSHCHLDLVAADARAGGLDAVLSRARAAGVRRMLCVGISLESYSAMRALVTGQPDIALSVGVHPGVAEGTDPDVATLVQLAADPRVVAVGETGLDYHRADPSGLDWQRARFRRHVAAARAVGKPLVIHTRAARADTIAILRDEGADAVGGVMHCFTETWEMAQQALELGLYISFSGILTFKNAEELRAVAQRVPLDRLLIETDAPYLAPVPYRGKPNEPRFVVEVAKILAALRGLTLAEIAEATMENYCRLFSHGIDHSVAAGDR